MNADSVVKSKLDALRRGEHIVTNDAELDRMDGLDPDAMNRLRSIGNPQRCGLLDQYVAWLDSEEVSE